MQPNPVSTSPSKNSHQVTTSMNGGGAIATTATDLEKQQQHLWIFENGFFNATTISFSNQAFLFGGTNGKKCFNDLIEMRLGSERSSSFYFFLAFTSNNQKKKSVKREELDEFLAQVQTELNHILSNSSISMRSSQEADRISELRSTLIQLTKANRNQGFFFFFFGYKFLFLCFFFHTSIYSSQPEYHILWKKIATIGTPPAARIGHTATKIDVNRMLIFGGTDGRNCFSDCHVFDFCKSHFPPSIRIDSDSTTE